MKPQLVKPGLAAITGLLLTAPAAYFILISALKYLLHLPTLFDASAPFFNSPGADKPWNINLVLVFGPLLAFLLNLSAITSFDGRKTEDGLTIQITFQRRLWNWLALAVSGACLLVLFLYAFGENCLC